MAAIEPGTEAPAAAAEAAAETPPDFKNVREAQAWQREHGGDPGVVNVPDEPITPVAPAAAPAEDDFSDVFVVPPAAPVAGEPAPAAPAAPTAADPYAEWGGRTAVEDAIVVANALKTENGVRAVVAQGLQALGYQPEQVSAFLQSKEGQAAVAAAAPAAVANDPFADVADDDVLDGATVKQMLGTVLTQITERIDQAQQTASQPALEAIQQDRQRNARVAVDSTLAELLQITDPTKVTEVQLGQIADIQMFAGRYLEEGNWDTVHISNAIRRGAADLAARDQARFQAYVSSKRAQAAAAPTNTGGGEAPGGEAMPEPKSAKEAAEMRKRFKLF